jgi:hypothetical protein
LGSVPTHRRLALKRLTTVSLAFKEPNMFEKMFSFRTCLTLALASLIAAAGHGQCPPPVPNEGQYIFVASPFSNCGAGLVDYDSWLRSLVQSGRYVNGAENQFGMNIQVNVSSNTGSVNGYEKAGLLVQAITSDPSNVGSDRDVVGADVRGIISSSNASGRAWGLYSEAEAYSGGDGFLVASELSVRNHSVDQPYVSMRNSKYGLILSNFTKQSTAAILINGNSTANLPGYWHKGLFAFPWSFGTNNGTYSTDSGDSFVELMNKFIIKPDGRTGIGVVSPGAQLSVAAPGAGEIQGTARSGTFLVSGGLLGTTTGSRLDLASIGFTTGVNNVSLGVTGQRIQNGSTWYGTALGLGMSVDNSPGAGANLWLYSHGGVGIGSSPNFNSAFKLAIEQGGSAISSGWQVYSSRELKENIQPIELALEKLLKLRGVTYDWKAGGKHDIGMIAEEVGGVIPEAVGLDEQGTGRSIDYGRLVGVLVEAVKVQQNQLKEQDSVINDLLARVRALEASNGGAGVSRER